MQVHTSYSFQMSQNNWEIKYHWMRIYSLWLEMTVGNQEKSLTLILVRYFMYIKIIIFCRTSVISTLSRTQSFPCMDMSLVPSFTIGYPELPQSQNHFSFFRVQGFNCTFVANMSTDPNRRSALQTVIVNVYWWLKNFHNKGNASV